MPGPRAPTDPPPPQLTVTYAGFGQRAVALLLDSLFGGAASLVIVAVFSKMLSAMPLYLGYLSPLWDPHKRTFHGMIVSTRVVTATDRAPSLASLVRAPFTGRRA